MVALAAATASLALTRQDHWGRPCRGLASFRGTDHWRDRESPRRRIRHVGTRFAFGIGNILTLVGLVVLGVSTLLDGRNDRVVGALLSLLGVAFALPAFGRTAGVPILCFVMAYVLAGRADPSEEPESPQSRER